MADLYGRRIEVTVAGLTITEPRIVVSLHRSTDDAQDRGEAAIYNLSPAHESRIVERGGPVSIRAGYGDRLEVLFEGEAQRVVRERAGLSRITRITLGDITRQVTVLGGDYDGRYEGVQRAADIARSIVTEGMGLEVSEASLEAFGDATFTDFYWPGLAGTAALLALCRQTDPTVWHFERDGVVRFTVAGEPQPDAPQGVNLSPENGLVRSVVVTNDGARANCLLRPEITLGCTVSIESDAYSGDYLVVEQQIELDNWEAGTFGMELELRPVG